MTRHSYVAIGVAFIAVACGGAGTTSPTAPSSTYDGQWSGQTPAVAGAAEAGAPGAATLVFTVSGGQITSLDFRFPERIVGNCRVSAISRGLTGNVVPITGTTFSYAAEGSFSGEGGSAGTVSFSWTGTFGSSESTGTVILTMREPNNPRRCPTDTLQTSWTARRAQ